eukprot:SAG25_NODE_76_length_16934_cov_51.463202_13_plen_34_part_00
MVIRVHLVNASEREHLTPHSSVFTMIPWPIELM